MQNRVILTENVKNAIEAELKVKVDSLDEETLLKTLRASKKFVVILKENGTYKVKQVLNG